MSLKISVFSELLAMLILLLQSQGQGSDLGIWLNSISCDISYIYCRSNYTGIGIVFGVREKQSESEVLYLTQAALDVLEDYSVSYELYTNHLVYTLEIHNLRKYNGTKYECIQAGRTVRYFSKSIMVLLAGSCNGNSTNHDNSSGVGGEIDTFTPPSFNLTYTTIIPNETVEMPTPTKKGYYSFPIEYLILPLILAISILMILITCGLCATRHLVTRNDVRSDPPENHVDDTSVIMLHCPAYQPHVHQKSESVPMQDNPAYESVVIDRSDSVTVQQNPACSSVVYYREKSIVQWVATN